MIAFLILFLHVLVSPFKARAQLETEIRRTAASAERPAPARSVEAEIVHRRPTAFGLAPSLVSVGVERHHDCPARDDHSLASDRFPVVLALEVALSWRSSKSSN
jgi:hypothetical protein